MVAFALRALMLVCRPYAEHRALTKAFGNVEQEVWKTPLSDDEPLRQAAGPGLGCETGPAMSKHVLPALRHQAEASRLRKGER